MTTTRKNTRIAAIVLTLAMLLGTFCIAGTVTAGAATDRVSLYSSSVTFSKYGARSFEVFVQTKDNASNQKVTVHYCYYNDQPWNDAQATYVTTLSDGSKIWKANFSSFSPKFAIKYEADGETIWDNNNHNDYTASDVIGVAPIAPERLGYQYDSSKYQINAVLQNYAYCKNVFVRYTTDGWKNYQDVAMAYNKTNDNGTETWTTTVNAANATNFQYAICYQVNGQEFWANNFGANYGFDFCIHH